MKPTPNPFNLIVEIAEGKKSVLMGLLERIQEDLHHNKILPLGKITSIHFARFVVLHEADGFAHYPDQLVFSTNYDGSLDSHLLQIIQCADGDADQIFSCCKGYDVSSEQSRLDWMKKHSQFRAYFYRGTWGLATDQIQYEEQSRILAEEKIDELNSQNPTAETIRSALVQNAKSKNWFKKFSIYQVPGIKFWDVLKVILLLPFVLPLLIVFLVVLLIHEWSDDSKQYDKKYADQERTQAFARQEDKIVQNQLTHLVEIKPGWFRLFTLRMVLSGIAYLAKVYFNKGKLGGIPTIHYARWIIIDKGKRLLFFSNFDGSWESYLGDFVDKAAVGLTAVWSNTMHFPKTRLLLFKGARDEQRFKSWARSKQESTNTWYSAYPDLTVTNIANNNQLHSGMTTDLTQAETEQWLMNY